MADEDLTFNEVKKLKVAELKGRLSKLGLHVSGKFVILNSAWLF